MPATKVHAHQALYITLQVPIEGREDRRQGAPEKVKEELVSV